MSAGVEASTHCTHGASESLKAQQQNARPKIKYRPGFGRAGRRLVIVQQNRAALFRAYCDRVAMSSEYRARKAGLAHDIDADFVEGLLIAQRYRCAISGLPLELPPKGLRRLKQIPFGPSLDRVIPTSGYTRGNVRVTCSIVNMAMNEWGSEALFKLVDAIAARRHSVQR